MDIEEGIESVEMRVKQKNYNVLLDMLRIIACAGVVATHMWQLYGVESLNPMMDMLGRACNAGANGVAALFCLSGYLAWCGLDNIQVKSIEYWKKRMLRLSPAYYAVLILYMLSGILPLSLGTLRYFTYTNGIIPSHQFLLYNNLGGLWTMSSFAFFYFVAPFLKKWIFNWKRSGIAVVLMFVFGKVLDFILRPVFLLLGADEAGYMESIFPVGNMYLFLMGVFAWYAVKDGKEYITFLYGIIVISVLLMVEKIDYSIWAVVAIFIIIISAKTQINLNKHQRIMQIIRFGSLISYEVYLSHELVMRWMRNIVLPAKPLLVLVGTFLLSYLLYLLSNLFYSYGNKVEKQNR